MKYMLIMGYGQGRTCRLEGACPLWLLRICRADQDGAGAVTNLIIFVWLSLRPALPFGLTAFAFARAVVGPRLRPRRCWTGKESAVEVALRKGKSTHFTYSTCSQPAYRQKGTHVQSGPGKKGAGGWPSSRSTTKTKSTKNSFTRDI